MRYRIISFIIATLLYELALWLTPGDIGILAFLIGVLIGFFSWAIGDYFDDMRKIKLSREKDK
jgi:hypothetical protein